MEKQGERKMEKIEGEIWIGENRIYLDEDNILYFINVGEIDEKIALESCEAMLKLMNMGEGEVDFLIDINKGRKTSSKARKILQEFTKKNIQGKLALWGLHPVAKVLASFFMGVTKKEEMRFFKTKEEALKWLKE
jgi:hypothetical protein